MKKAAKQKSVRLIYREVIRAFYVDMPNGETVLVKFSCKEEEWTVIGLQLRSGKSRWWSTGIIAPSDRRRIERRLQRLFKPRVILMGTFAA